MTRLYSERDLPPDAWDGADPLADRLVVTQYRDPITSESRTVTTCAEHSSRLLRVLRAAGAGCSSTYSPSFDCDPCENERGKP